MDFKEKFFLGSFIKKRQHIPVCLNSDNSNWHLRQEINAFLRTRSNWMRKLRTALVPMVTLITTVNMFTLSKGQRSYHGEIAGIVMLNIYIYTS